jgi:D-glycero-alpha-D-manno-heptose-7-phosphate kinase
MLVARSPLRISLGGGGTDLPSYYKNYDGFLISAAIDKYVFVSINNPFKDGYFLKYSKIEECYSLNNIQHPIIREAFRLLDINNKIELTTLADIPSGTGLGSSGSFTVALLKCLFTFLGKPHDRKEIADLACHIEIDILKEPIGKQDQYIASYGGINCFHFKKNNEVVVEALNVSQDTIYQLEDNLLLFFTGFTRRASEALIEQNNKTNIHDKQMLENLHFIKDLGLKSKMAFERGDLELFGKIMHEHWLYKKKRSKNMTNSKINECYEFGIKNGALGGKLVGAGGGGFLMFYTNTPSILRKAMKSKGLNEVRFRFEQQGAKIVLG